MLLVCGIVLVAAQFAPMLADQLLALWREFGPSWCAVHAPTSLDGPFVCVQLRRRPSIVTGLALAAGIPLGGAAGHWTWAVFAGRLGIPADFVMRLPLVLFMVPAVLLSANAVAFWPAKAVARVSPARVLRAE